jgi:hypothetical protein
VVDTQTGCGHGEDLEHGIGKIIGYAHDLLHLVFDGVDDQIFFYEAELSFAEILYLLEALQIAADLFGEPGIFFELLQDY